MKVSKFGNKKAYFSLFVLKFWKICCHIWNQHPQICQIGKTCEKLKFTQFGTKNGLFGYFWARISKHYCHIWNQHPQTCLIAKLPKLPKFGPKNTLFWYFSARILKKLLSYFKSSSSNLSNCKIFQKNKNV